MRSIRLEGILSILKKKGFASVEELAEALKVSPVTVRRDLSVLEKQGAVVRIRGGASLKEFHREIPFFKKLDQNKEKKMAIAREVTRYLREGQVVFASGGTTVYYVVQALDESDLTDLTIVTNSITTAWAVVNLKKRFRLIHTGGVVRENSFECVGAHTLRVVEDLRVDVLLLGADGVDLEAGITLNNYEECLLAKKLIENSKKTIIVVDSSKFGEVAPYRVCPVEAVSKIVTDDAVSTETVNNFKERGIELMVVEVKKTT